MKQALYILVVLFCLSVLACSSDIEGPTSSSLIDITGTWKGTYSTTKVSLTEITFKLVQLDKNVVGSFNTKSGATGTISGIINGVVLSFIYKQTTSDCPGTGKGLGTVSANTISFSLTVNDCMGTHSGGGSVTR